MPTTYGEMRTPAQVELDRKVLARVRKGIARLQQEYGDDWVDKVNLDVLHMSDGSYCVLGQINEHRSYHNEIERLFKGNENQASDHGFTIADSHEGIRWGDLTRLWQQEIGTLQSAPDTSGVS